MTPSDSRHRSPSKTLIRRSNLLLQLRRFKQEHLVAGEDLQAVERSFAALLQIHPSLLSHIKGARPISDKLAEQIEKAIELPRGWLDEPREIEATTSPGEDAFLEIARQAWRSANARGKRELRTFVMEHKLNSSS